MERFKACEKEMKTKAFSKEGLSAQQKLDPKEVAKMEMSHWVSTVQFFHRLSYSIAPRESCN